MGNNVKPGDIYVNNFTITSSLGTSLDISQTFYAFKVYEGITMPNCILELSMYDTNDQLSALRLTGGEPIQLSFNAPGTPTLTYNFNIDKVEDVDIVGLQKGKQYTITAVGIETLTSKSKEFEKAYNTNINSIISDIVTNQLNSSKTLSTENTQGTQDIKIPKMSPLDAIDMVRRRAVSDSNQTSTFVYFENARGLNFKTIEGMLNAGGSVKTLTSMDARPGHDATTSTANNIIAYQVAQLSAANQRVQALVQRTGTIDIRTRQYLFNDLKITGAGGMVPNPGGFNSQTFTNQFGQQYNFFTLMPWDSMVSPTGLNQSTPLQLAYVKNLLQCYIEMKLNGDTSYCAGDILTLNLKESRTLTDQSSLDPLYGDNFQVLITHICRNVGPAGDNPRYTDSLEVISGSLAS